MTYRDTAKRIGDPPNVPKRDDAPSRMLVRMETVAPVRSIARAPAPFLTQLIVDATGAGRASRLERTRRAADLYEAAAREKA